MSQSNLVEARKVTTRDGYEQHSAADAKEHYTAIVLGAGLSGMATAIQLRRKLGLADVIVYEKSDDIGGTWSVNRYPGAACDIPLTLYSFSFDPAYDVPTQWASQEHILNYLHQVQRRQQLNNVCFKQQAEVARFSRETGLWTLEVRDLATNTTRTRTCNILISCLGGLAIPNDPPFPVKDFDGPVFHSAEWPQNFEVKGKDILLVGNGCSASQIVPKVAEMGAKSVTQVARSRQTVFPHADIPNDVITRFLLRYLPGFGWFLRTVIFWIIEAAFPLTDVKKGEKKRLAKAMLLRKYIERNAPRECWDALYPDFDVGAKRRIFDTGYLRSLNRENVHLIGDDSVVSAKGKEVYTKKGKVIKADAIALATGFKVRDYLFPLYVHNEKGENLQERLAKNGIKTYQSTLVAEYPNFFWVMGPNSATGHSSVLFTSECQLNLVFHLIHPILNKLRSSSPDAFGPSNPAPYVEVTTRAEEAYWKALREKMKEKVWEKNGGVSWYVDKATGLCTTLYPWSQPHFWRRCTFPTFSDFKWTGVSPPASWRSWLGWY
ncbi:hypothetical protein JCM11251_004972 [Rhodosporidiobolus azoricus]